MKKTCLAVISGLVMFGCDPDVIVNPLIDCPVSPKDVVECAKAFERVRAEVVILEAKVSSLEADLTIREDQLEACSSDISIFDGFFIVCKDYHNKCVDLAGMKKMVERGAEVGRCDG